MASSGRLPLTVVLITLLASVASAAPATGTLDVTGALALDGRASLSASEGALFVGLDGEGENAVTDPAIDLALKASRVEVVLVRWTERYVDGPAGEVPVYATTGAPEVERHRYEAARLAVTPTLLDGARLVYASETFHARATRFTLEDGLLRGVSEYPAVRNPYGADASRHNGPDAAAVGYAFTPRDVFDVSSSAVTFASVADRADLFLYGFELTLDTPDGPVTLATGDAVSGDPGVRTRVITYALLSLEGVFGDVAVAGATAHWFAAAPTLHVDGAIAAATASGALATASEDYPVRDASVTVQGALDLAPARTTRSAPRGDFSPAFDPAFRVAVAGDVTAVSVAATSTFRDEARLAAAAGVVGAALTILYWPLVKYWATVAVLPFYSRLEEPQILANEVRNQIYTVIRESPGISARAVQRQCGQSWGTVVYHLRQLERHHLVTSRRHGRSRNFYENHGKYRGQEVGLATLNSGRAALVARAILAEPGITQERLSAATALPQPTTSYYVRKLKDAGLVVESRSGRYARYAPAPGLERLLATVDDRPDAPAAAPAAP